MICLHCLSSGYIRVYNTASPVFLVYDVQGFEYEFDYG